MPVTRNGSRPWDVKLNRAMGDRCRRPSNGKTFILTGSMIYGGASATTEVSNAVNVTYGKVTRIHGEDGLHVREVQLSRQWQRYIGPAIAFGPADSGFIRIQIEFYTHMPA